MARAQYLHLIWQGAELLGVWTVKHEMESDLRSLGLSEGDYRYERRQDGSIEQRLRRSKLRASSNGGSQGSYP